MPLVRSAWSVELGCLIVAGFMWGVIVRRADGTELFWCPAGSRRGGQDRWSPRVSQAMGFATAEEAQNVAVGFGTSSVALEYRVVRLPS